jgi:hypothetical protein
MPIKAPKNPRANKEAVRNAIVKSRGLLSFAAQFLGCERATVYSYLEKWPDLKQVVADQREGLIDVAESRLLGNIDRGDTTAIIFFLKTQGRNRGYVERQEITGADGGAVETKIVIQYADPNPHTA